MRTRSHLVLVGLATVLLTACAPARAASPPVPELVGDEPASPTTVAGEDGDGDTEGMVDLRRSTDAAGTVGETEEPTVGGIGDDVAGWAAFDESLRRSILDNGSPSLSVAVMVDGEVVRSSSLGLRSVAGDRPVGVDDRFRVASISKVITAIVLLQLVQEGVVDLDEPIGERLAGSLGVAPVPPGVASLTAEHLLSHTSGFGDFRSSFFGERGLTCAEAGTDALASNVAPGGGTSYSNMNYCLAHLLIEELTGQPYVDAVYQRLLAPLGITGMRLAGTYDSGPDEVEHFSRPGRNYMEALGGAGAWIATGADVARILDSLRPDATGWRPLGDDLARRMRQPPLGRDTGGYGLGLILYPDGSVGHTGTLESTHAMVLSRPDGVTWAILVNGESPRESANLRSIVDRALTAAFPAG